MLCVYKHGPFLLSLEGSVILLLWGMDRMRVMPKVGELGGRTGTPLRISDSAALLPGTAVCSWLAGLGD